MQILEAPIALEASKFTSPIGPKAKNIAILNRLPLEKKKKN